MSKPFKNSAMLVLGAAVFVGCFAGDVRISSISDASLVATAHARIGRPLTPVSYAGVARRTTRRAVVATGAVAYPAPVVVVAPTTQTCVDVVDAYGRITRRCQ